MFERWLYGTIGFRLIDFARKTDAVGELKQLRKTEFDPIEKLEALQFDRLKELLVHCKKSVPFYRDRFEKCGFDPDVMQKVSDVDIVPILTKDEIRKHFDQFKAVDFERYQPRIKETGGSTGQPLRLYHDKRSHGVMWANIYRGFGHAGYCPGDKYLTIASGSLLPKKLKKGFSHYFRLQNSLIFPSYHLDGDMAKQLAMLINEKRPRYIYGYSSTLVQFSKIVKQQGLAISGLESIFTTADMLYPHQRKLIESALNASVLDNYGCPEAGVMTWECLEHDGYHYNMESCYLQSSDCDDQGIGRLISTNLMNWAFPIIRYDTGDIGMVKRSGLCACGRSHSKVFSLLGRQRDIITLPSGRMIHGAFFNHLKFFYDDDRIKRFQIIQTRSDTIDLHIQPIDGLAIHEFEKIGYELEKVLKYEVGVNIIEGQFRESNISRKHRVVISDIDNKWTV